MVYLVIETTPNKKAANPQMNSKLEPVTDIFAW